MENSEKKYSLLANFERFSLNFHLNGKHMLWITLGTYLCYRTFNWYQKEREARTFLFQKYYSEINGKFKEAHRKATGESIHFKGIPDDGDWLYSQLISKEDYDPYQNLKSLKARNRKEFSQLMPLYFTAGLWFPVVATGLGFIYIFADEMEISSALRSAANEEVKVEDDSWLYSIVLKPRNIKNFVLFSLMGVSYTSAFKIWTL